MAKACYLAWPKRVGVSECLLCRVRCSTGCQRCYFICWPFCFLARPTAKREIVLRLLTDDQTVSMYEILVGMGLKCQIWKKKVLK